MVGEQLPKDMSKAIVDGSNSTFASGMTDAMSVGAIIMGVTALITFILLPKRVHVPQEDLDTARSMPSDETVRHAIMPVADK